MDNGVGVVCRKALLLPLMEDIIQEALKMSTAFENMVTRRSIRKYKADMVPKDIIEKVMEAGTYAANGMG